MKFEKYYGMYVGKVTEVDPVGYSQYGAIRVSLPDFMLEDIGIFNTGGGITIKENGLLAFPANNPLGGRNVEYESNADGTQFEHYYQGSVLIPPLGSSVWIFFMGGDIDKPFYWNAVNYMYSKLPQEQITADEPHKVYTLLKTHQGRIICVSDDENTQRVEITGKKRTLGGSNPEGNEESTYTIDDNMTTILLDEREKKEKILIRTWKGDYIHLDIDDRKLQVQFEGDINIKTNGSLSLDVAKDIQIKSGKSTNIYSESTMNIKSDSKLLISSDNPLDLRCTSSYVAIDGTSVNIQQNLAKVARKSQVEAPIGGRDD